MRYANLLANGIKEWTITGGEPTNKYLKDLGFEVAQKEDAPNSTTSQEHLVEALKAIGTEAANELLANIGELGTRLNLKKDDPRLSFNVSKGKQFSFIIGQRYCMVYVYKEKKPWHFIHDTDMPSTETIKVTKFDGVPLAYYFRCLNGSDVKNRMNGIANASLKEMNRTEVSGHRKHHNKHFEQAVLDPFYRAQVLKEAFGQDVPLTGNVWKLGCNWGTKKPSFYPLIQKRSIVIGVNDRMYAPGDLIVIAKGHTVNALGKVLEVPKPVVDVPTFETEFAPFEIEYNPTVNYATVEWYELGPDEIFSYQLQQGICRVNDDSTRNKALTIWNDRFINYWVFQCNPAEFDFETAVKKKLLNTWTVSAHKDKIKKGDKVILWLTGKRAGCYALARVSSDPSDIAQATDDQLWKTEPKVSLKAGIEVMYDLVDKPLLWQHIKDTDGLQDLKIGNQGTNFSATRKQFNTLLNLIDKSNPAMGKQIDLFINTILYGPPGTGKTYDLNKYKKDYFTDQDITQTSEEVLRESVQKYPYWEIIAAVLSTLDKYWPVAEILAHPIIQAKISKQTKTPQNTIWRILLSYSDQESSKMNEKYRGPIELFNKNEKSEWAIIESKKPEISNIIDAELLEMATNPGRPPRQSATAKTRYKFITFHQKYSYEDFIEGIKPLLPKAEMGDPIGDLQFELKKGIFYQSCLKALELVGYETFEACFEDTSDNRKTKFEKAKSNPSQQFALFIDEINRANISAVFGELITLLEDDKRMGSENELWVELPYSNEKFCVPANLYVIGTMNTADRSIALLDIALRRRFEFKALYPLYMEGEWWAPLLEDLNQAIYNWKKNPDFFIGHAFFINKSASEKLKILNTKIIPLLYEYGQNNAETVKRILTDAKIQIKASGIRENFQIVAV
jgi:hypothetical protein